MKCSLGNICHKNGQNLQLKAFLTKIDQSESYQLWVSHLTQAFVCIYTKSANQLLTLNIIHDVTLANENTWLIDQVLPAHQFYKNQYNLFDLIV